MNFTPLSHLWARSPSGVRTICRPAWTQPRAKRDGGITTWAPAVWTVSVLMGFALLWAWLLAEPGWKTELRPLSTNDRISILEIKGTVEVLRRGASAWDKATIEQPYNRLGPGDQLRTGENSWAAVQLSNQSVSRLGQKSLMRLPEQQRSGLFSEFVREIMYFIHRDKPGELDVNRSRVSASVDRTHWDELRDRTHRACFASMIGVPTRKLRNEFVG